MKIAILGFGVEGQSAYRYYLAQGHTITVCDANPETKLPEGVDSRLGPEYLTKLESFDLVVRSPGIKPAEIKGARRVTSVTQEFLERCPAPFIGVTGTKGKGTTATLISKMLEAAGKTVFLGGNIGLPALDFLNQVKPSDYVVLELSSFQLMDVTRSPQIGVMLMVAEDHLNYHADMNEYIEAKGNIFRFQHESDAAVYNADNEIASKLVDLSPGKHIAYSVTSLDSSSNLRSDQDDKAYVKDGQIWLKDELICRVSDVGLIGPHNLENVCAAAAAVWQIVPDPKPLNQAIEAFKGLPHRLELAGEVRGVKYFDDSFAVNPDAAIAALKSFSKPKIVILGGSSKGADFSQLARVVQASNVRATIVIGQEAPGIIAALKAVNFTEYILGPSSMPAIVRAAAERAQTGDVVLLSPGCASFDMFKDYKDRGDQFKAVVVSLGQHD